ncbi:MAG: 1-deoxy-D-xylulose-5-phosphate reductoisomerase [Ruminiclostridium sp.]|nr:1-deoxy-D-xylulose-5-phosphate reductoisomerase [Ruminiclostridium sp.]
MDNDTLRENKTELPALAVLGSTGSIGTQTLDVARMHGYRITALSAHTNFKLAEEQAREFHPKTVCMTDETAYRELKTRLADTDITVTCGIDALCETAAAPCGMVINAVVGMVGLEPTLAALNARNRVGLANKETLVTGGELVKAAEKANGVDIVPIDSEHSAIFQSLMGNEHNKIEKIILTASGGPFFGYNKDMLRNVTMEQALHHPNWSMGRKITTDSATLMNKGLELIEAVRLFDVAPEQVEVVVHRQSILHSAVEYEDGAVIGQLGVPDMKIPIQFAITYPKRLPSCSKKLSLFDVGTMTFERADEETFVCLAEARKAIAKGGTAPTILNGANEAAVAAFLDGKIPFYRIGELVCECCAKLPHERTVTLDTIHAADSEARRRVNALITEK